MNDLQKKQLEIFTHTLKAIEGLKLRYYLVCGSALGAVKYKGFIPWDDDIDIALPREDYEIFCKEAQKILPDNLFLQNYKTDPGFPHIFTKIRDKNTTFIERGHRKLNICHGVFIDVFPVDGYPRNTADKVKLEKTKRRFQLSMLCCFEDKYSRKVSLLIFVERIFGMHRNFSKRIRKYEKLISSWDTDNTDLWCNHGNWQGILEYAPKEHYGAGLSAEFEGISVNIPEKYNEYLTQKYGDWKKDLPDEMKVGHHKFDIIDLNHPYTEYRK